jgi:type I restriction-modification system DNA methylase subunit
MNSAAIVQKLWNYCNVLRDDGMSYGDYVEQLTYLLFLKAADRQKVNTANRMPSTATLKIQRNYTNTVIQLNCFDASHSYHQ